MIEELNRKIDDVKLEQLIDRLKELHENGVLRIRDWMAMYDLMLEACRRDEAETMEQLIAGSLNAEAGEEE